MNTGFGAADIASGIGGATQSVAPYVKPVIDSAATGGLLSSPYTAPAALMVGGGMLQGAMSGSAQAKQAKQQQQQEEARKNSESAYGMRHDGTGAPLDMSGFQGAMQGFKPQAGPKPVQFGLLSQSPSPSPQQYQPAPWIEQEYV